MQLKRKITFFSPKLGYLQEHYWIFSGMAVFAATSMMTAFALTPSGRDLQVQQQAITEHLNPSLTQLSDGNDTLYWREEPILRADTLSSLLLRLGITDTEAIAFLLNDKTAQSVARQLRPGKIVSAQTGEHGKLQMLYFPLNSKGSNLVIEKRDNNFVVYEQALRPDRQIVIKSGEIISSLFGATDLAGIPDSIATQLAEIFSADIDFYRDLRKGDRFSLVYETLTHHGHPIGSGRILSAEFINDQKIYSAYWFQTDKNEGGYYSAEGKNLRKAFLRSPLEFSRVTSGFSTSRLHPVLQITRAHKGIDYGAPIGTKVRSVADGSIDFAGWQGGYGKMIIIKHQGTFSTAYGHLNAFAPGLKKGARVSQGDTIGFTGQTGLASGPHLHYEFRINSTQINPLAIAQPAARPIETSQVARFKQSIEPLNEQLALAKQIKRTTIE